jgi:hypothetical protein
MKRIRECVPSDSECFNSAFLCCTSRSDLIVRGVGGHSGWTNLRQCRYIWEKRLGIWRAARLMNALL